MLSRRSALLTLALGTAGTVSAVGTALGRHADALSPLLFHSPQLEPFRDSLPFLPVRTDSDLVLDAAVGLHRHHSSLDAAPAFGYGASGYLGPVIEARSGVPTTVRFRNSLGRHVFADDIDTTLHGVTTADKTAPRTVVHLHGGVNPPEFDGHPNATIRPGGQFTHVFPNRQESASLWYHDHAAGLTRLNVYAGLAAPYLIRDRLDTGAAGNPLGLPAGEFEVPLVLQEKILTASGAANMRSTPLVAQGSWEGGAVGDVGVVNGAVWPELEVARGLYRFRILNAGSFSVWNLFFSNRMRFWVIGTDGGLLDAPVATTAVRLGPAERIDVLADFSGLAPGDTVTLRNDEPPPGQAAILGEVTMPVFCRFRVSAAAGFRGSVPFKLRELPPIAQPERVRNLTISQPLDVRFPPSIMTLNNLEFTSDDIETPRQGSVEQWNLINVTPDPHPIHVHLVTFRIPERRPIRTAAYTLRYPQPPIRTRWTPPVDAFLTGTPQPPEPWERGWKDTVLAPGNSVTRIVIRWPTADELGFDPDATFPGVGHAGEPATLRGYVWHCHVLDHEDHDMMLRYRLVR